MPRRDLLVALILMAFTVPAFANRVIPVWPKLALTPAQKHVTLVKTPQFGLVTRGAIQWATLTEYPAKDNADSSPAIIICPGGGYVQEALQFEGSKPATWFAQHGYTCFVLQYRLPSGNLPANGIAYPLRDVQRAMQIVRSNASKWHINPHQIGVMGFSAGGSVASLAGVHWLPGSPNAPEAAARVSSRPDFMILVYPVISMMPGVLCYQELGDVFIGKNPTTDVVKYYSSEMNVSASTPPAFICCAKDDTVVPIINEERMAAALRENHIPVLLKMYPHGGHAFGLGRQGTATTAWPVDCLNWLNSVARAK